MSSHTNCKNLEEHWPYSQFCPTNHLWEWSCGLVSRVFFDYYDSKVLISALSRSGWSKPRLASHMWPARTLSMAR